MYKKVLFIAYGFPPFATSAANRFIGFCKNFRNLGWEPIILAAEPASEFPRWPTDDNLLKRLPKDLTIIRVPDRNPLVPLLAIKQKLTASVKYPFNGKTQNGNVSFKEKNASESNGNSAISVIADMIFTHPDNQKFWKGRAVKTILSHKKDLSFDLVFASGKPWTSLLTGQKIAQKLNLPFVADFRDPWSNNPFANQFQDSLQKKNGSMERAVCESADRIITNTDELKQQFETKYPHLIDKFTTITNGFDAGYLAQFKKQDISEKSSKRKAGTIEISHFGTIYGLRNPVNVLQAVFELINEEKIAPSDIRLNFTGQWAIHDDKCESIARQLEQLNCLKRTPKISQAESISRMNAADILLLLQASAPLQIPAKIFEYLATGRPVWAVCDAGATTNLVGKNKLGRLTKNDKDCIKETLMHVLAKRNIPFPEPNKINKFEYTNLTQQLVQQFENILKQKADKKSCVA